MKVPENQRCFQWFLWRKKLMTLDGKSIARCLKRENFGNVVNCTLHHFSDTCESGYGQSSYSSSKEVVKYIAPS